MGSIEMMSAEKIEKWGNNPPNRVSYFTSRVPSKERILYIIIHMCMLIQKISIVRNFHSNMDNFNIVILEDFDNFIHFCLQKF